MNKKQIITINSTMLYVIAFLTTTMLHEFFHALVGHYFNSHPVLHHNYVENLSEAELPSSQIILIALAGPIISLFQGIISSIMYLKLKSKTHNFIHLLLLWLSVLGFFNFLGYVMTGPFFGNGDIGKVYTISNMPVLIQIVLAVIASAFLLLVAYKMTAPYLRFSFKETWIESGKARKNFSLHILLFPWIIGSIIITILYLPIIALVSIIYPIMSGMIFIFPWQNANTIKDTPLSKNENVGNFSIPITVIFLMFILVFKVILAPGIEF